MNGLADIIAQLERQRTAVTNALEALREIEPSAEVVGTPTKAVKRSMSPDGRQRQIAAMKKYWAKRKRAAKKAA